MEAFMEINLKIDQLGQVYNLFDNFAKKQDLACKRQCSTCCTCNMTLTTLEGLKIISDLDASQKATLTDQIQRATDQRRYQPKISINQMAQICMQDGDIPDEVLNPSWGQCPILIDQECPIYTLRPFSCRCMMSRRNCSQSGIADMDDFTLTIADLFNQFIEHLDTGGLNGNLIDVMLFLDNSENLQSYQEGQTDLSGPGLIRNHPIPILMIPPEYRLRVTPLLESLTRILQKT
jgi:Fe-S-cluster containining protein